MRQTGLTLEKIQQLITGKSDQYRPCMLANELGDMARGGDKGAAQELAKLLDDPEERVRAPAYACLCESAAGTFGPQLVEFAKRPENAHIVFWARKRFKLGPPS